VKELLPKLRRFFRTGAFGSEETTPSFVDIHSHIIPAIDDGPSTIEEVVKMLRRAHENGTREMVATPHMFLDLFDNTDPQAVRACFDETAAELKRRSDLPEFKFLRDMTFYPGAENYISRDFLNALEAQRVLTLNDSRYILVEALPYLSFIQMEYALDRILDLDLIPIIAHPERYLAFHERPTRIATFLEKGCLIQVNGGSLLGVYGRGAKKISLTLLKENLVHILASDSHGPAVRPHDLGTVYSALGGKFKPGKLKLWLSTNPGLIVRNETITA